MKVGGVADIDVFDTAAQVDRGARGAGDDAATRARGRMRGAEDDEDAGRARCGRVDDAWGVRDAREGAKW